MPLLIAMLLCGLGCGVGVEPPPPSVPAWASRAVAPGVVRVQLVFGEAADLDLFVTDPDHEEVYFGNSPTRLGGRLDADRLCGDPAPRIETVRFSPAPPGRYRVSVDFPKRCHPGTETVTYRVVVDVGEERQEVEQVLSFGDTEQVVIEFDVSGD